MKFKLSKKNITVTVLAIIIFIAFFFIQAQLSGKAISDLDITYTENQPLKGVLTLITKSGELIPAGSILKLKTENKNYEFILKDLLDDQQLEGNYYIEGEELSGSGSGFGKYGNTGASQDITFTLIIKDTEVETETPDEEEETPEESNETITEEPAINETIIDETPDDTNETITEDATEEEEEEVIEEEITEEEEEEVTEEEITEEEEEEVTEEEITEEEEIPEELFDITVTLENNEIRESNELITFVALESFGKQAPTIDISYYILDQSNNQIYARTQKAVVQTEKVIKRVFTDLEAEPGEYTLLVKTHYGEDVQDEFRKDFTILGKTLFQKIMTGIKSLFRITGEVSYTWEGEEEITKTLNRESSYTIEIPEGKTIEISPGSIKDGSTVLSDSEIKITRDGNLITLTTNYQDEETRGFGENYLGSGEKEFAIDISDLNLTFEAGELTITLEHENTTIIKTTETLGEITSEITSEILPIEELTQEKLDERITMLSESLENASMKTTEKTVNNKIIVRHEIGIYWATFSYDINLETSKLEEWKMLDKRRFTEDTINTL